MHRFCPTCALSYQVTIVSSPIFTISVQYHVTWRYYWLCNEQKVSLFERHARSVYKVSCIFLEHVTLFLACVRLDCSKRTHNISTTGLFSISTDFSPAQQHREQSQFSSRPDPPCACVCVFLGQNLLARSNPTSLRRSLSLSLSLEVPKTSFPSENALGLVETRATVNTDVHLGNERRIYRQTRGIGYRLYRAAIRAISIPPANWAPYGGCFEGDFISTHVVRRSSIRPVRTYVRTYAPTHVCTHMHALTMHRLSTSPQCH